MPVVPGPRVSTAPLSGAKLSPAAPSAAFGVQATPDLSAPISLVSQLDQQARKEADETAYIAVDNQLHDLKGRVRTEVQDKFKGLNALGATDYARDAWQKGTEQILSTAPGGDHVKLAMQRAAATHWGDLDTSLTSYAHTEFKQGQAKEFAGAVDNRLADAVAGYADPAKRQAALDQGQAVIRGYATHNGWGAEETKQRLDEFTSATHASVIERMVNDHQDLAAKQYLDAHRAELHGKDLGAAERLTGEASVIGAAQRASDRILNGATGMPLADGSAPPDGAQTLTAALSEAAKITDPRVRDNAEHRVRQHFADLATADREAKQAARTQASSLLEKNGGDVDAIPLSLRQAMSAEDNNALQHRADQIRHPKDFGDSKAYFYLLNLASVGDESRKQFMQKNILSYKGLSDQQRAHLLTLQRQYSTHDERTAESEARFQAHGAQRDAKKVAAAPAPAAPATPAAPARPFNPLAGLVTPAEPTRPPTKAMLDDVARKGPGYAKYLRNMGYNVPAAVP